MSAFIEVLLPVFVVVACGFSLRRAFPLDLRSLNRVSIYILSPALIFTNLVRIQLSGDEGWRIAAVSVVFCLTIGLLTLLCAQPFRPAQSSLAGLLLCTMFMNAGNYGLPISRFAFGEPGFQRAMLFFIPQTLLAQLLAIPIARVGNGGWRSAAIQILRMPQIYAVLAAALVRAGDLQLVDNPTSIPGALFRGITLISEAALPLLLLILGMQLAQEFVIEQEQLTALAVLLRLLISPFLAYALAQLFGISDLALRVTVLQASMPTAVNMVLYSLEFDAQPRFVAGVVVVTTLLSLGTLTLLLDIL